jgi:pyruvate,water dikinase
LSAISLTESQVLELGEIALKIEKHFGFPQDIEWAIENGRLYILQSRNIRTLKE